MATEEWSKPVSHPPYPEMIFAALEALKEKDGSNKSAISKYIESTYGELPAVHSSMLSHHLNRMKESGQLVFVKNNYMKFDPNAPPRRGRGRPPKPKIPQPEAEEGEEADEVLASPRPRGRPRKDPNAPPAMKKLVSSSSGSELPPKTGEAAGISSGPKSGRPRGRPPKVKPQQAQVGVQ